LANGIRFFIGREEQNLADPQVRFMLAIHAAVGAYNAKVQTKKSLEARIHRAKRGVPTSGNKPFGRIWDDKGQKWLVDEEKKRIVVDCADRFLAGEAIPKLAAE